MKQTIVTNDPSELGEKALTQVLADDYQQAAATLVQLATAFRAKESQLRHSFMSPEDPSVSIRTDATAHCKMTADRRPTIAFFCLGKFQVEVQRTRMEMRLGNKALAVLKFLIQRRRPCPREVLIEALWPESEPEASANRLRVEIHSLRQAFASSVVNVTSIIAYRDGCYELNPNEHSYWIDADEFEALWRQGARFEADGRRTQASQCYEEAELLYRGDYLEEDLYEEWTLLRRESLRDAYLYILGKLAGWHFEKGSHGDCISCCHKLLTQDPYREDAYRLLMRCYVALGQKANALHWYEVCYANLRKGLDVNPSLETASLQRQIMATEE